MQEREDDEINQEALQMIDTYFHVRNIDSIIRYLFLEINVKLPLQDDTGDIFLPLIFADGNIISLDEMTELQLEAFGPFMVLCSMSLTQAPILDATSTPKWWPKDLPFAIPLQKPIDDSSINSWSDQLKEIVAVCYQFHAQQNLLQISEQLSAYSLRFHGNITDSTTISVLDRSNGKLLATIRTQNLVQTILYITDDPDAIQPSVDAGCVPILVGVLAREENSIHLLAAIGSLVNITAGSDDQVHKNPIAH